MVALPDTLNLDPVEGQMPSRETVQPTDFGLEGVAQNFDSMSYLRMHAMQGQARLREAQAMATPEVASGLANLQGVNEADLKTAVANNDAAKPGFVGDLYGRMVDRVQRSAGAAGLTPDQQGVIYNQGMAHAARVANAAASAHGAALAAPIEEAAKAQAGIDLGNAQNVYRAQLDPAIQTLQNNYLNGDPNLIPSTMAAHDQAAAAALASAPESVRPQLSAVLAGERAKLAGSAFDFMAKSGQTSLLKGYDTQIQTAASVVYENPASYDGAMATLDTMLPTVPAGLRDAYKADYSAQMATARLTSLIHNGHADGAQSELQSGKYNDALTAKEVESLGDQAAAAMRSREPVTQAQADTQASQKAAAGAYALARRAGGDAGPPPDISKLTLTEQATYKSAWDLSAREYAGAGAVGDMPNSGLIAQMHAPPPTDTDKPGYAGEMAAWVASHQAAEQEIARRQTDPALWAMGDSKTRAKAPGAMAGVQRGDVANASWAAVASAADPASRSAAGATYAKAILDTQHNAGIGAPRLLPVSSAAALAATVDNTPPEGREKAIAGLAQLYNSMPLDVRLADGSHANARAMMARELIAAHMNPVTVSALADFADQPGAMGKFVAAFNDPIAAKPLPGGEEKILAAQVRAALAPELKAAGPLSGTVELAQARIDRTMLIARHLVGQGVAPQNAATTAAATLTEGYKYAPEGWRMPVGLGGGYGMGPSGILTDGMGDARNGAHAVLQALTANHGANMHLPPSARADYPDAVANNAKWVNSPDGSGLTLTTQKRDGSWQPVTDKWGRAQAYSWSQLQNYGRGYGAPTFTPPPAAHPVAGAPPVPAASRQTMFRALSKSIETQESGGRNGLIAFGHENDPDAPVGVRQMRPSTANPYALRLFGQPVDAGRLRHDPAYARPLSDAAIGDYITKYGATAAGLAIAVSAYYNGETNTDRHLIAKGDPRHGVPLEQWLNGLPKNTRPYTIQVLNRAFANLRGG